MFERIGERVVLLKGEDYSKELFKKEHSSFKYSENSKRGGEMFDKCTCCYIVTGEKWKSYAQELEQEGLIFWKDIFPDWAEKLIHENEFFVFEEVKRYVNKEVDKIADIFEYIAKYKRIAMVYGNCQSLYVSMLLQKSKNISNDYVLCRMPWIQNIVDEKEDGFDERYMSKVDLFIYQIAGRDNIFGEKLSTDEILPLLKMSAIKISIPFTYFEGYFPQYIRNMRNDSIRRGEGHVPYGDIKIQGFLEAGKTISDTARELKSLELFSEEEVIEKYKKTGKNLKVREEKCDIKILDFIEQNYQKNYLFYTPSHPTNFLLVEVVNRILRCLRYEEKITDYSDVPENDKYEMYIYPSVKKHLRLSFQKEKFCLFKESEEAKEDEIEQYVEKYAQYCFPELNENIKTEFRAINIFHMLQLNNSMVEERRRGVFEISGKSIHLSLYLTVKCNCPKGEIFSFNSNYAPNSSYIFPAITVVTGQGFPCTIYPSGKVFFNGNLKKGQVLMIDTTWIKK